MDADVVSLPVDTIIISDSRIDEMHLYNMLKKPLTGIAALPLALILLFSGLSSCSNESLVPDGYWRFEPPTQARLLKKQLVKTEADRAMVLTYFAGPMLNTGVNTETTAKSLLGHMYCGHFVSTEDGIRLQLDAKYELNGEGQGEEVEEIYSVDFADHGSLLIEGLMNFPDVPYVSTDELTNEEALAFQQFSGACKNQ
jgi:hypothetical protein